MATGEKRFIDTAEHESVRYSFEPFPSGEYDVKLLGETVAQGRSTEGVGLPYVKCSFEALDTATKEGGKNRKVFHFFGTTTGEDKNGVPGYKRADQIVGFNKGIGENCKLPIVDEQNNNGDAVECIDPRAIAKWLKDHDGITLRAKIKIERAKKGSGYNDQNKVEYFIETEAAEEGGEAQAEEEVVEEVAEETAEEAPVEETVAEEEPAPPPPVRRLVIQDKTRPAAKPVAKTHAKPAPKKTGGRR